MLHIYIYGISSLRVKRACQNSSCNKMWLGMQAVCAGKLPCSGKRYMEHPVRSDCIQGIELCAFWLSGVGYCPYVTGFSTVGCTADGRVKNKAAALPGDCV